MGGGSPGRIDGDIRPRAWSDVGGGVGGGGAERGTRRHIPTPEELYAVARSIEAHAIDALLIIGGLNAYPAGHPPAPPRPPPPALQHSPQPLEPSLPPVQHRSKNIRHESRQPPVLGSENKPAQVRQN